MKPELVKFCRQEVFDRIFKGQEMINYILNGHEVESGEKQQEDE